MNEKKEIVFTDSSDKELFRISDGSFLKQTYGNGETNYAFCRYVDSETMKLDGHDVEIRQFVQRMEHNGIDIGPVKGTEDE